MRINLTAFLILCLSIGYAQTNIKVSTVQADNILKGNFNPSLYLPSNPESDFKKVIQAIQNQVKPDSLHKLLLKLEGFKNRNTASDTVSDSIGIGAARRWVYQQFEQLSSLRENRLQTAYLEFNHNGICSQSGGLYKNIFTVLPGTDTSNHELVIIEGHIDSRCENVCDLTCFAEGMEDNATGTALVMELARVMSQYSFPNTIVFLITIGEEQGLYGAEAFAKYCKSNSIPIRAVLNNDVIGGIICGETSSPPSCPGLNDIDSTQVRIFSFGKNKSKHKGLARYIKMQYQEELLPIVSVPMLVSIMNAEDRTNRGGDHIPFRQEGFSAVRFTSANEHGNANPVSGYTDRQHSTRDVLGVDTDSDGIVDSFFVDFNYLSRNAVINGVAAAVAAKGIAVPNYTVSSSGGKLFVHFNPLSSGAYKIGIRTLSNDFNAIYTSSDTLFEVPNVSADSLYFISAAYMDAEGYESLFGEEIMTDVVSGVKLESLAQVELLNTFPNPFDESTTITAHFADIKRVKSASIHIQSADGKLLKQIDFSPKLGLNEILYNHGYNATGILYYTLFINGEKISTKRMVFVN
jgi:hypothetical protein